MKNKHLIIGTDANYLPRAIVFYKSLLRFCSNFILHVFCFDDVTYEVLRKLDYQNVNIYSTSEFEDEELLKVKQKKARRYEYYWA